MKKINLQLGAGVGARARIFLQDNLTGKKTLVAEKENLALDNFLNALATTGNASFTGALNWCGVGSGTNPNQIASGTAIFTQSGNTLTSSSPFFNAGMVGAIVKYDASGSSGTEQYITGFTSTSIVTVSSSAILATPFQGTVWQVQQTSLQSLLYSSNNYQAGGSGITFLTNVATIFQTFVFPTQGSSYNVNEVSYGKGDPFSNNIFGRIVLGATVVVPTTSFLVCEILLTVTQNPNGIVSVGNVGTNFNTAGNAAIQWWDIAHNPSQGSNGFLDQASGNPYFQFRTANDITLNSSIATTESVFLNTGGGYGMNMPALAQSGNPVGVGTAAQSYSFTTAGETCYSLCFGQIGGGNAAAAYAILLTTPVVLPVGTLQGTVSFQMSFTRTLVN